MKINFWMKSRKSVVENYSIERDLMKEKEEVEVEEEEEENFVMNSY